MDDAREVCLIFLVVRLDEGIPIGSHTDAEISHLLYQLQRRGKYALWWSLRMKAFQSVPMPLEEFPICFTKAAPPFQSPSIEATEQTNPTARRRPPPTTNTAIAKHCVTEA